MKVTHSGNNSGQTNETSETKQSGRASSARPNKSVERSAEKSVDKSGDVQTDISPKAREFARAKGVATQAPDVREEKIAELKKRIEQGKYHVDAPAVADRLVNDHLVMPN